VKYKNLKIIHQYCEIYFTPGDAITGGGQTGWAMTFVTMAAGCLLGPIFLTRAAREQ
jgi:hypothetical protein